MNSTRYRDALYEPRELRDIKDLVNSSAIIFNDRGAFLVKDKPGGTYVAISYLQLKRDVDALGTALTEMGFSGRKIALIGENRYEWVVSYLAVINGVGVIVPIDRELCEDDIADIFRRASVDAVIYSSKYEGVIDAAASMAGIGELISMDAAEHTEGRKSLTRIIARGSASVSSGSRAYIDARIDREAMCALLFTSGTTGLSKGVMLSHKNFASNVYNMSKHVDVSGVSGGSTGLSVLPMHHTYEMTCHIMTSIFQGCRIAICEGLKYIVKNMAESKASVLLAVPLIFENMHKKVWKNAESKGKAGKMRKAIMLSKLVGGQNMKSTKRLFKEVHQAMGG
ncbi:MAG: long-chain fatty acid--CoA ligase, partial [Clostridiales Family XIII bacterium]|nr:long-chain fatty acid--CoA ligase [Clostridiales Family XIII bacterium]